MTYKNTSIDDDPAKTASLWRKLLALRIMALCLATTVLMIYVMEFVEDSDLFPESKWLKIPIMILALLPFWSLLVAIVEGLPDLVIHFTPEGKMRRFLLWDSEKKHASDAKKQANRFEETAYGIALLPVIAPIALLIISLILGLIILLVFGVGASIFAGLNSFASGTPSWAIVIIVLLVSLHFKK